MTTKKANGRQRRRFQRALMAALSVGNWSEADYPIVISLERKMVYCRGWRNRSALHWAWEPRDTWAVDIGAAGASDFLDGCQTVKVNRDEKTKAVTCCIDDQPNFVARIAAIANAAWDAGIRNIEAKIEQRPNGHEQLELAAEAERWFRTPSASK